MSREATRQGADRVFLARRRIRLALDRFPRLFMWVLARSKEGVTTAGSPDVKLVVEGYPRSANTFMRHALATTQPSDFVFATHVHASANVRTAVRKQIPTVVLVRKPEDAVLSLTVKVPQLSIGAALAEWVAYYTRVWPLRRQLLFVLFDEVTRDLPAIVLSINERFGTGLAVPDSHEDTARHALSAMARSRENDTIPGHRSSKTETRRRALLSEYRSPPAARLRSAAERLYEEIATNVDRG